jgi:hypothetical protein
MVLLGRMNNDKIVYWLRQITLIAATCIEYNKTLATRYIADFEWIEGLNVINPLL